MGKENKNTPVSNTDAGVTEESRFAADKAAADKAAADKAAADKAAADKAAADKAAADKAAADKANSVIVEAKIISPDKFIAENGDEFDFTVAQFTFQGKTYTKEEALSNHPDVLEHLALIKSFILKKV